MEFRTACPPWREVLDSRTLSELGVRGVFVSLSLRQRQRIAPGSLDRCGELRAAHLFASRAGGRRGDRRLDIRHLPARPYSDKGTCFVIFEYPFVIYLAAPNFLAFDLRTCPESFRGKSASEVAEIDYGNQQLAERGTPEQFGGEQPCQEQPMPRQAGRAGNES